MIWGAFSALKHFEAGEWQVATCILERSVRICYGDRMGQSQSGKGGPCHCSSLGKRWWWPGFGEGEQWKDWREVPKVEEGCGNWVREQSKMSQEFRLFVLVFGFCGSFWGHLGKLGWVWIHSLKGKEKMSPVLTTLTSECPWDVQASSCTQASEHRGRANRDLMCDMWPSGHWLRPKWIVNIGKSIEEYYYLR